MSAPRLKAYRFTAADQWARCLVHRIDVGRDGALLPIPRLAQRAALVDAAGPVTTATVDPDGRPLWRRDTNAGGDVASLISLDDMDRPREPFEITGAPAAAERWVVDRRSIWAAAPGVSCVDRYERTTIQHDGGVEVDGRILDLAPDGRDGVWLLLEAPDATVSLIRVDCKGRKRTRLPVPPEACAPRQLASVQRGRQLVLLGNTGTRLTFLDAVTGNATRVLNVDGLAPCWSATHLAGDGGDRLALWGSQAGAPAPAWSLVVLDGGGDTIDGPLADVFADAGSAAPADPARTRVAVKGATVWLATDRGLWRLGSATAGDARESDSTILTPALLSPDSNPVRGWLRAEVTIDLPRGAVLEAEYATTDDQRVATEAANIAASGLITAQQKQASIWALFDHPSNRRYRFTALPAAGQPIAVPLFERADNDPRSGRDRWLWLRLRLTTPPATAAPVVRSLRVLYPELSIGLRLPRVFQGEAGDPTLRRLVGVLEATTQRLDERISRIGSYIEPRTAPSGWLDYLGRWLDLPWDDALPDEAKRRLLVNAGSLLDERATRAGLIRLLSSLVEGASVRVTDLTVDHAITRLGGRGLEGARLPALLAGLPAHIPTLGAKAVVGRARLSCTADPLDVLKPSLRIDITTTPERRAPIAPLLDRVLAHYVPAGIATTVRWHTGTDQNGEFVLDANGEGRLGRDSAVGRTVLSGRAGVIGEPGFGVGTRLR